MVGTFLLFHVGLLLFFRAFEVTPMVYFNMFSIAFYAFCFLLIYREMFKTLVISVFFEVEFHMLATVWCVGWDYGFQVTLFGIALLGFFSEYIGRSLRVKHVPAIPLAVIGACFYLISFMLTYANPPQYNNLADVRYELQIIWGIVTFVIIITCMAAFTLIAFRSEELLSSKAEHDRLTGLPNRYFMADYLARLAAEEDMSPYWLAMIDIDDFKKVNDTYGHTFGDEVLRTVADALASSAAGVCTCRWGGEEFLMVGKCEGDVDVTGVVVEARERLDRVRNTVAGHSLWHDDERVRVTVTIGAALYHADESVLEWVNRADAMLYEGKRNGKNQVVFDQQ